MRRMLFLSVTVLYILLIGSLVVSVEASSPTWTQTYGETGTDIARSLIVTSDGGYAIAGYTSSFGAGNYDFWVVKTDDSGNVEWNQTCGGPAFDRAYALVEASDGGYTIAGYKGTDFWLVKLDELGNVMWNQTYKGTYQEIAYALVMTSDGGYALAGSTTSFGAGGQDFWLAKTILIGMRIHIGKEPHFS